MNININIEGTVIDKSDLEKYRQSLAKFAREIVAPIGTRVAGQHTHQIGHFLQPNWSNFPQQAHQIKTEDDYLIELGEEFTLEEATEIFRLCKGCAMVTTESIEYYVQTAIREVQLGFSKDYVRYALYQTCMAPRDELKAGNAEEQFFK
jgi:hypothetical protein